MGEKHEATPDEHSFDIRIQEARAAIPFETDIIGCRDAGFYDVSVLFTGCEDGAAGHLTGKYDREDENNRSWDDFAPVETLDCKSIREQRSIVDHCSDFRDYPEKGADQVANAFTYKVASLLRP
jgi:hypothetical protein